MKLLVLILGARCAPYPEIINNSLATWGSLANENISVYPYYGNHNKTELVNGELLINTNDLYITYKTLLAYDYILNNFEFDYLHRVGASTYSRIDKCYEYLLTAPREKCYVGNKQTIQGITYASGTHLIFSRDIVQKIVENKGLINDNQWAEDWVIGKFLEKNNIQVTDSIPAYWLLGEWPEFELLKKLYNTPKEELEKYMFFRCKTEILDKDKITPFAKRNDILKMNYLHKVLYS
jgi:hypothetical protein